MSLAFSPKRQMLHFTDDRQRGKSLVQCLSQQVAELDLEPATVT